MRPAGCAASRPATWASARDGEPTDRYTPGVELIARETLFAEGCRGSLTKTLIERFQLRDGSDPQTYAIGIKELWEVAPDRHQPGLVVHTVGWPLDGDDLWRVVPLSPRKPPGRGRVRHRARLPQPASEPVRGVPALQDAPGDPAVFRGRAAHRLWRAGAQRGRVPVDPAARFSRAAR